jgi:hypothetical protein
LIQGRGFLEDDLTDHALRFIEANKDWPDRMIFSHGWKDQRANAALAARQRQPPVRYGN